MSELSCQRKTSRTNKAKQTRADKGRKGAGIENKERSTRGKPKEEGGEKGSHDHRGSDQTNKREEEGKEQSSPGGRKKRTDGTKSENG